jgi:hypothetical protein
MIIYKKKHDHNLYHIHTSATRMRMKRNTVCDTLGHNFPSTENKTAVSEDLPQTETMKHKSRQLRLQHSPITANFPLYIDWTQGNAASIGCLALVIRPYTRWLAHTEH